MPEEKNYKLSTVIQAAQQFVLDKYALFKDAPDPVKALTEALSTSNFGYKNKSDKASQKSHGTKSIWGPPAGLGGGDVADRLGIGNHLGGV